MCLYLTSRCCYGEAGWRPPGNSTWVKRDPGPREMFLRGFLLAWAACAGHGGGLDPQGRAVPCPAAPPEGRIADGGASSREDREAEELPAGLSVAAAPRESSTDKELYPQLSPLHEELFFKKKKKIYNICHLTKMFRAFWVLLCD